MGLGRNGDLVANTPLCTFPPRRGGFTVGTHLVRFTSENPHSSQRWEYSSIPLKAAALRYSGSSTTLPVRDSANIPCRGSPNLVGKSVRILPIICNSCFIILLVFLLFHKSVNGLIQLFDGLHVPGLYRIHQTMLDMILQNHFSGIIDRCLYCRQLNQHFATVSAALDHFLDRLQVANCTGQTVQYRLDLLWIVGMGMRMAVTVLNHSTIFQHMGVDALILYLIF